MSWLRVAPTPRGAGATCARRAASIPWRFIPAPGIAMTTAAGAAPVARSPATMLRRAALLSLVTVAYVAAAWLGLRFAVVLGAVSPLWPPTGLALAALVLLGRRSWPAVALGVMIVERWVIGLSWPVTLLMTFGNTLEAWLGATLLARWGFRPAMDRLRDAGLLVSCAALAPVPSATAGALALCGLAGVAWSELPSTWGTWWAGDAMSALVVTPMLLAWLVPRAQVAPGRPAERAVAFGGLVAASLLAFFRPEPARHADAVLALLSFPFMAWLALRFTRRAAAGGVVTVAAIAIVATGLDMGPFDAGSAMERSVLLQVFLAVTGLATLALSTAVSGQRRAEAQREESLAFMKEFSETLHHAAWISELPGGRLLWASPAFERLFGEDAGWRRRVHPEDAPRVEEAWRLFTGDDARDRHAVTYRLLRDDGRTQWIAEEARRIRDPRGRGVRASGLARDATADVREREERVHLERRVHEVRRNESLAHLAGGVAHDFNNTLQVILVASELTRDEVAHMPEAHDHLGRIAEAARHAAGLCRQMLAYAGSGRVEIARHDLGDVVREALESAAGATPANVSVRLEASREPLPVRGDAANLQQAVLNLVSNACDAVGGRGGEVIVRTGRERLQAGDLSEYVPTGAMPGDHAFVEVEDRGTGMQPEVVSRLFEPFFSTKFLGRGLGLPAVLGIARAARGGVRVRTRPGDGSTFRLILPVDEAPAALGEAPRDRTAPRVLVVDDDPDVRAVLAGLLGAMGVEHVACADAGEALEAFRSSARPFDLVLLDLVMPGLPAEHALREMLVLRKDVRIVVMSGLAESEVLRLVGDEPVAGYLHKPFGIAEAAAWIRTVMSSGT